MSWLLFFYTALLFFVLTPGILITLPPKGKKITVAAVHATVFGIVWVLTHKIVYNLIP